MFKWMILMYWLPLTALMFLTFTNSGCISEDIVPVGSSDSETEESSDSESETESDQSRQQFLYSIDFERSPSRVVKYDIATGELIPVCELAGEFDDTPYFSATFARDNRLYAIGSPGSFVDHVHLAAIDPCDCDVAYLDELDLGTKVYITANESGGLYVATQTDLYKMDTPGAVPTVLGPIQGVTRTDAVTWSDALYEGAGGLYVLDGEAGIVGELDPTDAIVTASTILEDTLLFPGFEMIVEENQLFACSGSAQLLSIDLDTGHVEGIGNGSDNPADRCYNIAAPWAEIICP